METVPNTNAYLNISLSNRSDSELRPASYSENRQVAILDEMSKWQFAITRFRIPSFAIPIFRFRAGSYFVTLQGDLTGNFYQEEVMYIPTTPSQPDNNVIYNYESFLTMINTALETLTTAFNTGGLENDLDFAPFITYNPQTQLFSLFGPKEQMYPAVPDGAKLMFSAPLFNFFSSMDVQNNGLPSLLYPRTEYTMMFRDKKTNTILTTSDKFLPALAGDALESMEETVTLQQWSDIRRIILGCSQFPAQQEMISVGVDGSNLVIRMYTDFTPSSDLPFKRDNFQYIPSVFRWTNFQSTGPLTKIDLQVFVVDRYGETYVVQIPPNEAIEVKIGFRLRSSLES